VGDGGKRSLKNGKKSAVVVVDVNNFNCLIVVIDKYCPKVFGNAKTVDAKMFRFHDFSIQSGMERIIFKKPFLFFKLRNKPPTF